MTEQQDQPEPLPFRASDADREQVAQILHQAAGAGRLTMVELEERLDQVYAAKTIAELAPLTADLPEVASASRLPSRQTGAELDHRIGGVPGSSKSFGIMSSTNRTGIWVVPRQHTSFTFWGSVDIDLRQARFVEGNVTITAVALMGAITIVVPDDINVEVTGVGFMGNFGTEEEGALAEPAANAPTVKVNGFAFWGEVLVKRKPRLRKDYKGITR